MAVFHGVAAHDGALRLAAGPAAAASVVLCRQAAHNDLVIAAKRQALGQRLCIAKVQPPGANQCVIAKQRDRACGPDAGRRLQRGNQIGGFFHGGGCAGEQAGAQPLLTQ